MGRHSIAGTERWFGAPVGRVTRGARWSRLGLATAIVGAASVAIIVDLVAVPAPVAEAAPLCATPPGSGSTAVEGVVNTYYPATSSITANTAGTTVQVGTARGGPPLAVGDLVLVIQMQGAEINATNTGAYGDGAANDPARGSLANANATAGRYEYARVSSVSGSTVGLTGAGTGDGLVNSYVHGDATGTLGQRRFQIVRVPQYYDATLSNAVPPTALPWDGSSGGILALDVAGQLTMNDATASVDGLGFRGGVQRPRGGASGLADTDYRTPTSATANGQKGEGIAGTPRWRPGDPDTVGDGYPNGDFGRGAPGNAGGGGTDGRPSANDENTGGGGGGNGGTGGTGGFGWNSQDPYGGFGGAPFTASASSVVMGGGGGAGSDNNGLGSSAGGAGGGIVLVRANNLSGTGTFSASGAVGGVSGQDGGGGGGAGGSIVVLTRATGGGAGLANVTFRAPGGAGGNTTFGGDNDISRHGPGGGGAGGAIVTSATGGTRTRGGAAGGTHTPTGEAYGATAGTDGTNVSNATLASAPGVTTGSGCIDVAVSKSLTTSPLVPGQPVSYTVVVTNNGPFPRTGTAAVNVVDTFPAGLSSISWLCSTTTGSTCGTANGSGNINTTANLARGGSATYTITGTLAASFTGVLSNTASATGPAAALEIDPSNNQATAAATAQPRANLGITKSDPASTSTPGTSVTYTVVATNAGPSRVTDAVVADALPAGALSGTWACTAGACGSTSGSMPMSTTVTLDPGQTATWSVTVNVSPSATGSLANTATITAPSGTTDPDPANNLATDTNSLTPRADLSIGKTDGVTTRNAGEANPYTITVANAGPSTITGATVTDTFPASYTGASWTCLASAGSSCPTSGSGNISASVTLAPGGTATFSVTGTIDPGATGTLSNTASVALPGGAVDPTPLNNSAIDTTTITRAADLSITKTDGSGTEIPGTSVTYEIVATNAGPSTAVSATVTDTLPAALVGATWICTASPGSSCPATGTGNINAAVTLAPAGTATFTLTATVAATATGTLVNTASIAAPLGVTDPTPSNNSATDTNTLVPTADLTITKTDGATTDVPGTGITYTVVASSTGPSTATDATVTDVLPAGLTGASWTCAAAGGATCPASGTGNINALVTLPAGGTATFTITATIDPTAVGTLSNTAAIATPVGITDPVPGDNSATDTTTLTPTGDLAITKTNGVTAVVPGQGVTYTVVASNAGPSAMTGVAVTDTFPAALAGATWTCAGTGGGTCTPSGSGNIADTVSLPVGASVTYTVTATVAAAATGTLANTAGVAAGPGTVDPDGSNNSATDSDTLTPTADVSVTKTDGVTTAVPGQPVTYTIVASNVGPSDAPGTVITDVFPAALAGVTWTCTAAGGATCPAASGSGDIAATVDLPVNGSVTYTATGTVLPGSSGSLVNTAQASVGSGVTDPAPSNNSATDTDLLTPRADLTITKTDGATTAVPGSPITYSITATNTGPSTVTGATIADTLPAALTGATWTCVASAGSTCPASGSGDIAATVTLLPSGTATFTLAATVAAGATGNLVNTATVAAPGGVTDPTPSNNTVTDTNTLVPTADLSITKTDGAGTEVPGTAVVYTVVVANAGPSDVSGAAVTDVLPSALLGGTWACSATAGSSCPAGGVGDINASVSLLAGGTATFTITAIVSPTATGNLVNTATVAAPSGVTDPNAGNDSATDTDTLIPTAELSITKTDGITSVTPGQAVTYTIVASNAGPSTAVDAVVTDVFPAELTGVSWTCAGSLGGTCPAPSGTGDLAGAVTLPPGASVTFTVSATVVTSALGSVVNTATVSVPAGVIDPTPGDNTATDTDTIVPTADLSITKTDGAATAVPGSPITYTIVVANAGPSAVAAAAVTDTFPAALLTPTWTCTGAGGGTCPAAGSGSIAESVALPAGASVTFTVSGTVSPTATGLLVNTATVSAPVGTTDPQPGNDSATDTNTLVPTADLSITKTDGTSVVTPGGSTTYTVVVTNAGPSAVAGAPVADALPAGATGGTWTCAPAPNCAVASGAMPLASSVTLAPLASVTYTVTVDIAAGATGSLVNTATVAAPAGAVDPTPGDNAATDTNILTPAADVSITKTDGLTSVVNGQTVTYSVVVTNPGPSDISNVTVADPVPAQLTNVTWTCVATGASLCTPSGTGSIADIVNLAAATTLTYTVTGTVTPSATGTITNTATVSLPGGVVDPTPGNNTATDLTSVTPEADLSITKTDGTGTATPGGSTTYTIVVANAGPADVAGATVTDPLPAGATATAWTCAPSGGATCEAAAGTDPLDEQVDLPVGGSLTYTVTVDIDPGATGSLVNVATVAAPLGVTDPAAGNDSATDTDLLTPEADVSVTKTDGVAAVTPGGTTTYTIVVANAGPSDAPATLVTDPEPAGATFTSWTCTPVTGAGCGATAGSGPIGTTVDLPAGTSVTFTVVAAIDPGATGTLDNTVTTAVAAGIVDPDGTDDQVTDSDTLTPVADLSVTKSNGSTFVVPGTPVTYTVEVANAGPSDAPGATVTDVLPAALLGATWTCVPSGGATCAASGTGDIAETVDLPAGSSLVLTVSGTVSAAASGTLDNTAEVDAPAGVTDPDPGNDSATDSDPLAIEADLSITKSDGITSAVPGQTVTYTIVAANDGPSAAPGTVVADTFPAELTGIAWTCAAAGGATCGALSGTGNIAETVDLPVGGTVTYTATATVRPGAIGTLSNTATVSTGPGIGDPTPGDNAATDSATLTPVADLTIAKTDGATVEVPGTPVRYTIVVGNAGPSTVSGATVSDPLPSALTSATWTCTATAGSTCPASGTGGITAAVSLLPGGSATFELDAVVDPAATGTLSNTATVTLPGGVTDPTPGGNTATDIDTLTPQVDLGVTKTDGTPTAVPGTTTTYTIEVTNDGPSTAADARVTDPLPIGATGMTWTCSASAGSACAASGSGPIDGLVDVAPAGTVTFTVVVAIDAGATGLLENEVEVAPATGTDELTPADNVAVDIDTLTPAADLSVTKTNGASTVVPGDPVTYTIVVANAGPSDVVGATVGDVLPPELSGGAWNCVATGGGTCSAAGAGDIADTFDLPAGATLTYTLTADVASDATGTLENTADVIAPPSVTDPSPGDESATDTDTLTPVADLSIAKDNGTTSLVPGESTTYTIAVSNAGPSAVIGASVSDVLPASLDAASWTCAASPGSTCPAAGTGDIAATVDLAVGGTASFVLTADVVPGATVSLSNTATVGTGNATDPNPGNNSATDVDTLDPVADLRISKTDGLTAAQPGDAVTYTITVSNTGPSAVVAAPVTDTIPAELTGVTWSCAATGGACGDPTGTGNIATTVDLGPGGTATFTVTATVGATTGSIVNTAQVDVPAGVTDPDPGDNAATDTTSITPTADLSVTKTDGRTTVSAGETVTYTITVANAGPSPITGATVTDAVPATLAGVTWTCTASAGSACEAASGTGDLDETVTVAAGGTLVYAVTGSVPATAAAGTLTNTATVTMPAGTVDPTPGNNTATDTTTIVRRADLSVTKTDGVTSLVPGSPVTYTIVVSNAGPAAVAGARVVDTLPAALVGAAWTCTAAPAGSCSPSGIGDIDDTVTLPPGASATYVLTATVSPAATGTLTNTVTVTAPAGVVDPVPGNDSATDSDTLTPVADLSISKTDGATTAVPGAAVTYTIVVTNTGPSAVTGATVADTPPASLTGVTWTCAGAAGGVCGSGSGTGAIADTVDLPVGGTVTYLLSGTVDPAAVGTLVNTATVAAPATVTDPDPSDNAATDSDTLTPVADLSVTKTDGSATAVPGTPVTYTIVAANAGPSDAPGAVVGDVLPPVLTGAAWTCTGAGGGSCPAAGTGDLSESVDLPAGGSVTFTLTADVDPAATGSLVNTVTVTAPGGVTDPAPGNDSATDTDTLTPEADLSIAKTDGLTAARPGDPVTYTVTVANAGPSAVAGAAVADAIPAQIAAPAWTCAASPGSACPVPAAGTGDIAATVDLAVSGTVTFTVTGTVAASATGTATNVATVTAPLGVTDTDPSDNAATDLTRIDPLADLAITKTDGNTTAVAGEAITYTITVTNAGPSAIANAPIADPLPSVLVAPSWTCTAAPGSGCDTTSGTGDIAATVDLASGGTATFTVTATIAADASGTLTNTATVAMPGLGLDPTPGNNTATDTTTIVREVDLEVTKTDGLTTATPGDAITYTITVRNAGPSDVAGAVVGDPLPAALTGASWTCTATGGGDCTASGTGSVLDTVDLPAGAVLTYVVDATIDPAATGSLVNTATVVAPPGVNERDPSDDSATDTTLLAPEADLSVVKTDGGTNAVPGEPIAYTITVANAGPSDVVGASVSDVVPPAIAGAAWTCAPSAGASCSAAGFGDIADTVDLPAGASVVYTLVGTVVTGATGSLVNTATVTAPVGVDDPVPGNDSSTDTDTLAPEAAVSIVKTDGVTSAVPGGSVTYTITVANAGPSDVVGATVEDLFPATVTATWTCAGAGGATCTAAGAGDIVDAVDLPAGGSVVYTVAASISPAATGNLVNTATVTLPPTVSDPDPSDNADADTDTLTPIADLSVTKTDGLTNAGPGDPITYTIVVANAGPSSVSDARVEDDVPAALGAVTWTCAATGGTCPASGSGDIDELVDVDAGGSVTFTVSGTVSVVAGTITNTASVDAPAGVVDPDTADNTDTDTTVVDPTGDVSVTKTDGLTSVTPGTATSYTIVVANGGPSDAIGVDVVDLLPAALVGATWTCTPAGTGASCTPSGTGDVVDTIDLPGGTSVTYTVVAQVAPAATGTITNTVTVTPPVGFTDTDPANDTATDSTDASPLVDVAITKTDGATTATPGLPVTYTIVVTNDGPSDALATRVSDPLPAALSGASWTCAAAPGSACGAATGSGSIDELVDVGAGSSVTFSLTATVAPAATGTLVNTATVTVAPGTTDATSTDDTATDVDTLAPRADVSISKTNGRTTSVPGEPVSYSITVTNAGPSAVVDARVLDAPPASMTGVSWTCGAPTGGGACDIAAGVGPIDATVDLPVGASVTFVLDATVLPSATGTLANTASVVVPPTVVDPDPTNDSATDTDSLAPAVDLAVTKSDGVSTAVPGASVVYTITVTNAGPSDAVGATLTDPLPVGAASASWTCTGAAGATCDQPSGAGAVSVGIDVPVGGLVTLTSTVAISPTTTGLLVNTATVTPPSGVVELDPTDDAATDVDTLTPRAALSITKTDGVATALPGDRLTYTIAVTNAGPSAVTGAPVGDVVPPELTNATWTCVASDGACGASAGTGDIATTVDLAPGGVATFVLGADVVSTVVGTIANTATVDAPAGVVDPDPADNAATDSTTVSALGDVSITKTDGRTSVVAGTATSYSVVVTNPGPSVLTGVRLTDPLPAALTGATWTCTPSGGAVCSPGGAGSIDELVDLPAGGVVTYTISATVATGATGTLTNTATAALPAGAVDPTPANNVATDTTAVVGETALSITKTDGVTSAVPGTGLTYTITATNAGPSDAVGARVTDPLPASLTGATWTCSGAGGGVCPASGSGSIDVPVTIPVGGSVTFLLSATVAGTATGTLSNTAAIAPPTGASDPDPGDNAATDVDLLVPTADIAVTKTDGVATVIPGTATTYTIVVSNLGGPSTIAGVEIVDPLPAGVTGATWTCSAAAGSACGDPSGTGPLTTTATVAPGADVTYTVTMQTAVVAGTLTNTVTATVPPGSSDPDPANNTATDVSTLQLTADLSISKLASVGDVLPGDVFTFTVVARNAGPNPLAGVTVTDPIPAGIDSVTWVCLPSAGASCGAASGTGALATTASLDVGASVTYVLTVRVAPDAVAAIVNTASVAPPAGALDPDTTDNTASASVTVNPIIPPPSLGLTKSTSTATFDQVGDVIRYTLTAENTGGVPLTGVRINDPGAQILTCNRPVPAVLAPGELLVCDAERVVGQADLDRGFVANTADAVAVDPDGDTIGAVSATVIVNATVTPRLSIVKSTTSTGYSRVGDIVAYSIVVRNTGNVTLTDVTIRDAVATVLSCPPRVLAPGASMTCAAERSVTQGDLDTGRIDNVATAEAVSSAGTTVQAVSGVSNLVTVRRIVILPGTGGDDDPAIPLPLPGTGAEVGGLVGAAAALTALGLVLTAVGRRRRHLG